MGEERAGTESKLGVRDRVMRLAIESAGFRLGGGVDGRSETIQRIDGEMTWSSRADFGLMRANPVIVSCREE